MLAEGGQGGEMMVVYVCVCVCMYVSIQGVAIFIFLSFMSVRLYSSKLIVRR